ncbi:AAA family ATPase [Mycoplasma sp. B6400]|uniref:AAA family ATPase n=1 Tax=Mycoplasma sp. B6400 TaxID=3401674 RepID=UPI003AB0E4EB
MKIRIKHIFLQNFKGVDFYNSLILSDYSLNKPLAVAPNGWGKTTILESITFLLTGKDLEGKKLNPQNLNNSQTAVAEVTLTIDNKDYILSYKNSLFYINDNMYSTKKYFKTISSLLKVSQKILLSIISPTYFFTLSPKEKRSLFVKVFSQKYELDFYQNLESELEKRLFRILKALDWDSTQLKADYNSQIRIQQDNLVIKGIPQQLIKKLTSYKDLKTNKYIEPKNEVDKFLLPFAQEIEVSQQKAKQELEVLKLEAITLDQVLYSFTEYISQILKKLKSDFTISLINENKEKEELVIKHKNIDLLELNTAKQVEISISLSTLFSKLADLDCFILLDNCEHIDSGNLSTWAKKYSQQFLITKVVN